MPNKIPTFTPNPTSTVTLTPWYVHEGNSEWVDLGTIAANGGTKTFAVEEYPSLFYVSSAGATDAKHSHGFIAVTKNNQVFVTQHQLLVAGATSAADQLGVTISSGTVTLTSHSTAEAKTNTYICRMS